MSSGDGDLRGDSRAFGSDRILRHLDEDLLSLPQHFFDVRDRSAIALSSAAPSVAAAALLARGEFFDVLDVVAGVQEGGLLEADVHEGRLHAGEHPGHPPEKDIAHDSAVLLSLEMELDELIALEDRHPGFPR